ncbi:MAG: hypothetical protein AB1899_17040 [Pseudomonadota bacterium]
MSDDTPDFLDTEPQTANPQPQAPQPMAPRRRLQQLLAIPDSQRTEAQWDEINELEITLAPGNRVDGPLPSVLGDGQPGGAGNKHKSGGGGGKPRPQGGGGGGGGGGGKPKKAFHKPHKKPAKPQAAG